MKPLSILLLFLGAFLTTQAQTQSTAPSPIVFIYDASGSMWGQLQGKTKMKIAADVLSASVNSLPENQQVGLVAYGHRKKGDCRDVEALIPMDNNSKNKVTTAIKAIKPLGKTPLAYSATTVIDQLRKSKAKATIILVTDGIESCDGDICKVIKAAKEEGIDFRLHIVGFGLKEGETEQLKCAAKAGEGQYYDAADASGLSEVLNEVTTQTVDKPPVNFGVYAIKNGKAIDASVKAYDTKTKRRPIGVRTYRDTGYFYLPPSTYNLEVIPLEGSRVKPITIKNVISYDDKVNYQTVSFDAGKFNFITTNNEEGWDCTIKVKDQSGKSIAGGRTYGKPRIVEVNPGTYDITIQALRMKGHHTNTTIEDVQLTGGILDIKHDFKTGKLYINPTLDGTSIDCTSKVVDTSTGKSVAGGRTYQKGIQYIINPGTYEVTVRPVRVKGKKPKTITVEVKQGEDVKKEIKF